MGACMLCPFFGGAQIKIPPSIHASIHPSVHPSMHTYIHTYIHTHIYTYSHIYKCMDELVREMLIHPKPPEAAESSGCRRFDGQFVAQRGIFGGRGFRIEGSRFRVEGLGFEINKL